MTDRVVVITGSAGGIGSEMVKAFDAEGDVVVGLDLVDGFDITNPQACRDAAARIEGEHGRIDVLCNNAGIGVAGDVVQATPEQWQSVFAVNVFGLAYLSAAVLPGMRQRRSGVIVNTCSVVAEVGLVERAVYGASKGAVHALTQAMAADEVANGIRVNCISPGTVQGPWVERRIEESADPAATRRALEARQPLGRLVGADEVAAAAVYLAASTTYTTGISLILDGGIAGVRIVR
jgi:NAD(P)-dependent dehydrogenase (short-subunit alcohol dehydrogenase family)